MATEGPRSLLRRYLRASTLPALVEQLCLQECLDSLSDQELTEVWRRARLPERSGQGAS